MRKTVLYIFLLIISIQPVVGQKKELFNKVLNESMEIKFRPQYPTETCPNYFIDEIAKALPKIRMYVKINYQYQMRTIINKEGSKYILKLRIDEITHGGNYKYKDFDFSHLIAPERIEQTFLIKDLSSNTSHYQKVRIGFHPHDTAEVIIKGLKGVITYRVTAKAHSVKYLYTDAQKIKFQKAVKNIDTYYDDALRLDALKKRIEALDFNQADVVALRNVDLKYIEKDLNKIKIESYKESLNLDAYDPIRLLPKYDSVKAMVSERRQIMDSKMGSLDEFYFKQAQNEMQAGNEKNAIEFYKKSIEVNPYFSPAIYQLSFIDYQHTKYSKCLSRIKHILNELKPNQSIKKQSIHLSKMAYDSLMNICKNLNKEERFNQSIGILYKTKSFCDSTQYIECDSKIDQYISQAVYGLYASYLSIARASLDKGRLDMCQDYMEMANGFRKQNSDKLMGNSEIAKEITKDLIAGLVQQSEVENTAGNTNKAIKLLGEAKVLCEQNPNTGCKSLINKNEGLVHRKEYEQLINQSLHYKGANQAQKRKEYLSLAITYQQLHSDYIPTTIGTDTILGKVRFMMYNELISNGLNDLKQDNYSDAFTEFKEAYLLEQEYVFTKDANLPEYLKQSAKPFILKTLEEGKLKAWGKYYDEAALLLDSAVTESKKWNLSNDSDIKTAISELEKSLKKNVCDQLSKKYNTFIKKANTNLRFDDYYHANLNWTKALSIVRNNRHCKLDSSQAYINQVRYQPDINYKTALFVGDSLLSSNAGKAFEYYLKAEKIFATKSQEMHSKSKKGLLEMLIERNNTTLNILGIQYFNKEKRIDESYKLIIYALESGQELNPELIKETAQLIADYDIKNNTASAEKANSRFGTKKELLEIKKAYRKSLAR